MDLILKAWGAAASRLNPQLVLDAARRLLASPAAQSLRAAVRRRLEQALRDGAVDTLLELMRRLQKKPADGGER
jgi:hypothetical protein